MATTKKIFCILILLLPVFLITGPAIPDIIISLASIFLIIYIYFSKEKYNLVQHEWFKISIVFWLFLIFSSFFAYNLLKAFTDSLIFIRLLLIPALVFIIVFESQSTIKYLFVVIFSSVVFVIFDTFLQFLNYDSITGFGEDIFGYIPDNSPHSRLTGPFKDLVTGAYVSKFSFFGLMCIYLFIKNRFYQNLIIIIYLAFAGFVTFISGERMAFATFG